MSDPLPQLGPAQDPAATGKPAASGEYWKRILYMIGYGFIGYFVLIALYLIAIVQAIYTLVSGKESGEVKELAQNLTRYLGEVMGFVSWASDRKPFPASDAPSSQAAADPGI